MSLIAYLTLAWQSNITHNFGRTILRRVISPLGCHTHTFCHLYYCPLSPRCSSAVSSRSGYSINHNSDVSTMKGLKRWYTEIARVNDHALTETLASGEVSGKNQRMSSSFEREQQCDHARWSRVAEQRCQSHVLFLFQIRRASQNL